MNTLILVYISCLLLPLSHLSTDARALLIHFPARDHETHKNGGLGLEMAAVRRQEGNNPSFPANPPSCPICSQNYASIDSCAAAAPVLANFSMVIFNPGAFIDVIKCSCTDTFRSAYPQCVDCFTQTNQTSFLSAPASELPDILTGIRNICALESTLLGNASAADGEASSSFAGTSTGVVPTSTLTSTAMRGMQVTAKPVMAMVYVTALGLTGIALCVL